MKTVRNTFIWQVFVFFVLQIGCSKGGSKTQSLNSSESSSFEIPIDSINSYFYTLEAFDSINYEEKDFRSFDLFPKFWVGLYHLGDKLALYHYSNRYGKELLISDSTFVVRGLSETVKWPIKSFNRISEQEYLFNLCPEGSTKVCAKYRFEILDVNSLLAIVTLEVFELEKNGGKNSIGKTSDIFIPQDKQHLFFHINEPNIQSPYSALPFKEINFDSLRAIRQ